MDRRLVLLVLCLVTASVGAVTTGSASPGHGGYEAYGATAGDPRVWADGAKCFAAANNTTGVTCAVLYGHIFRLLDKVPINVQHPPQWYGDVNRGFPEAAPAEMLNAINEMVLYSSPGFVEYGEPHATPRLHPERGITADVRLPFEVPILGYWYMSADFDEQRGVDDVPPGSGLGPDVGVMPCLTVVMTLETGHEPGQGDVLARGSTTRTLVNAKTAGGGQAEPLATTPCPGDRTGDVVFPENVTEFEVVLEPQVPDVVIPQTQAYHVHVEWYQFAPGDPQAEDKFVQHQWNVRTGPDSLARLVIPVEVGMRIERAVARPFDGKVFVQAEVNSPWGSYDFDPGTVAMRVLDAAGNSVPIQVGPPVLRYSVDHESHWKPVRVTWEWAHTRDLVTPGVYTVEISVRNWQHTATASSAIPFRYDPTTGVEFPAGSTPPVPQEEKAPGPALVAVLTLALGAVAWARRRP